MGFLSTKSVLAAAVIGSTGLVGATPIVNLDTVSASGNAEVNYQVTAFSPPAFRAAYHGAAVNTVQLTRKKRSKLLGSSSKAIAKGQQKSQGPGGPGSGQGGQGNGPSATQFGTATLTPEQGGSDFVASIKFGTQSFTAIVDTGSSDTWLVQTGFKCINYSGQSQPQSACRLGNTFNRDSSFTQNPNQNFNISYGDGEYVTGFMGNETVTFGGITVPQQTVALVNQAYFSGDGVSSGLVGLAYPALTSAYSGTNPTLDTPNTRQIYSPLFTSMYKKGLTKPVFSLVLSRGTTGSLLGLGGVPGAYSLMPPSSYAVTPLNVMQFSSNPAYNQFTFYTIFPNGFIFGGAAGARFSTGQWASHFKAPKVAAATTKMLKTRKDAAITNFPVIVDSGTTLVYLPNGLASAINAAFDPPGYYDSNYQASVVQCSAKIPQLGVVIGGRPFWINSTDMILNAGLGNNLCLSGIQNGGSGPYILGDVFLKNVVAVFDVGASQMRFAAHSNY